MRRDIFEEVTMDLPECYREMTDEERACYYPVTKALHAYIYPEKKAVICSVETGKKLDKEGVEQSIYSYQRVYSRIAPGFEMGQIFLKNEEKFNVGVITFKSNALERDLFNLFAVLNVKDKEAQILMSCNVNDAVQFLDRYVDAINSIEFVCETENR